MRFDPKSWGRLEKFAQEDPPDVPDALTPDDSSTDPEAGWEQFGDWMMADDKAIGGTPFSVRVEELSQQYPDKAPAIENAYRHYIDAINEVNWNFISRVFDLVGGSPGTDAPPVETID